MAHRDVAGYERDRRSAQLAIVSIRKQREDTLSAPHFAAQLVDSSICMGKYKLSPVGS